MAEATFQKSTAREYFESIVVAVILALFIRTFVVQAFKIPTGSMEPNLLVGDHLLVNKFVFAPTATPMEGAVLPMRPIRRGDVIVFKFPEEPERDFIKRVIGLPGETVELRSRQIFINGQKIDEPYAHYLFPQGQDDEAAGFDLRGTVRAGHGAREALLHDGRQPRQLAGQPLLGLPAGALRQGPGAHHLLVVRAAGWRTARWSRGIAEELRQHVHRDALEPDAETDSLKHPDCQVSSQENRQFRGQSGAVVAVCTSYNASVRSLSPEALLAATDKDT